MEIFRGVHHANLKQQCALTIGNFDGFHRGHQAMVALLRAQACSRGIPSCVLTFEPHPRDYFAAVSKNASVAPARISTLRDKLQSLACAGVDKVVILPFKKELATVSAEEFVTEVIKQKLSAQYVLVGDDFRFGAKRSGAYGLLSTMGAALGIDVASMDSYELENDRISSTAVRSALGAGDMLAAEKLLGCPYHISGHVLHGRKLGRMLGFRTLNLRFSHWNPAAFGIFIVSVHGLSEHPLRGVANLGIRPSLDQTDINGGRVLLEVHCLDWPNHLGMEGGYGKIIKVDLLHKLHDEKMYPDLEKLRLGIKQDHDDAIAWFNGIKR